MKENKRSFRHNGIFWGLVLVFAAVVLVLEGVGVGLGFLSEVSAVRIILGVLCVAWAISEIVKLNIPGIFFPIAFTFMLFESEIAEFYNFSDENIIDNWVVLLAALFLTVGTGIIFPKSSSGEKRHIFSASTKYIDCSTFSVENIENNMSSYELFFENTDLYQGNGIINLENNMGSMEVHIPHDWRIVDSIENNLGSVKIPASGNADGKVIFINGENNMGSINITLI